MNYIHRIILLIALIGLCSAHLGFHSSNPGLVRRSTTVQAKRDESSSSGEAGAEEEEYNHGPQGTGAAIDDETADFDYAYGTFVVPPLPTNTSIKVLEYAMILQTPGLVGGILSIGDWIGIYIDFVKENPVWQVNACVCPFFNCTCTEYLDVNPGDVITAVISLQNGVYTASGTSSGGVVAIISDEKSTFYGPLGVFGVQFYTLGAENCNNYPPSDSILTSDIVLKNRGEKVTIGKWATFSSITHCSNRVSANEIAVLLSWNSNDWFGNLVGCGLSYFQIPENSWTQDGQTFTQYSVYAQNIPYSSTYPDLQAFTFKLSTEPSQIWAVEKNADGSYSIPSYAFPIPAYGQHIFGYISTKRAVIENAQCAGGEPVASGDQPGFATNNNDSPINSDQGCSVSFTQEKAGGWGEGTSSNSQVNVIITNTGPRAIRSLQFSSAQGSLISQAWSIERNENGNYALPSWVSNIPSGGSISFGYIVNSGAPVEFTTSQISCS